MPLAAAAWLIVYASVFPDPYGLFQSNWPLIGVGVAGAFVGNATAVGGGLVFLPVMLLVYELPAVLGLKLAIASQCFGMTSGTLSWLQRGLVPVHALRWTVPGLLVGSTISTLVVQPNVFLVKGVFGPVSILIGALILLLAGRDGTRDDIPKEAERPLFFVSVLGGLVTGWVAIGEGEIIAAFLMLGYRLRIERGVALGVVLLSINSLYLLLLHELFLGGMPWEMAMFTGLGCLFGARLGPYLAQWVDPHRTKLVFGCVAIADGVLFVWQAVFS